MKKILYVTGDIPNKNFPKNKTHEIYDLYNIYCDFFYLKESPSLPNFDTLALIDSIYKIIKQVSLTKKQRQGYTDFYQGFKHFEQDIDGIICNFTNLFDESVSIRIKEVLNKDDLNCTLNIGQK